MLIDVLLVRALCTNAKANAKPLESWLKAVEAHAAKLLSVAEGANSHADAYLAIARLVAELFRTDQSESGFAMRQSMARKKLRELQPLWSILGGSKEQRGVLLEAIEGPVVCGAPEVNFDKLFF